MKFSENWLRTLVNPPIGTRELADALSLSGLDVEQVDPAAAPFSGVVIDKSNLAPWDVPMDKRQCPKWEDVAK